ncbi:MAG TPA: branched-chain amino acid ABC transporter substrate-binding protein [Acidimicrobiia bacterium]|nr:branched-chain amino acid ABC transporter substrate-binding protein [Acidimicrobiia bacterium]
MKNPRRRGLLGLSLALALVLAACGGDTTDTTAAGGTDTTAADGTDTTAADGTETTAADGTGTTASASGSAADACAADEFGCVEYAEGEPITIGSLLVISGANASLGTDSQYGVELAADYIDGSFDGEAGQFMGRDVAFNHQDDGCSAEGGQAGAQALASDEKVVAVIGTSCSSAALGVADTILSDRGIAIISPSNTGPALTDPAQHQEFYLRTAHNDLIQGAAVANFAAERGITSAATIHDGSPYADGLQQAFADVFSSTGGTITKQEAIQVGDTDFNSVLTDIAADSPQMLYFPIFVAEGGLITQQARAIPEMAETVLAGSDGMFTPDWITAAGAENANGVYISGPDLTALADPEFYDQQFLPEYEERFGSEPQSVFHAHAFDATNLVFQAIEDVAIEEEGTLFIPRTALKDALYAVEGYQGVTGTLTCDDNGDCQSTATMAIVVVEDGEFSTEPVFSQTINLADVQGGG